MLKIILSIILAAIISGCASAGTKFDWANARKVQAGMSQDEVVALMGKPYMVAAAGDGMQRWIWSHANGWTGGARTATLTFQDGKVVKALDIPDSFK
jgi:uncharacterized protein YceK